MFNLTDEYIKYFIAEENLTKSLSILETDNKINYNLFSNLLSAPIGMEAFHEYVGFYLGFNIKRELLGFSADDKPGDYDILIIPYGENQRVYFERTIAIETKVVRPTRKNPQKAPNSYGISQLQGLINDGFPLVGLIHFCMTEPLLDKEKGIINMDLTPFDMDNPKNNKEFMQNIALRKMDNFSWASSINQMKRLISKDIPKYVGLCAVGVNVTKDNKYVTCFDYGFNNHYDSGYFNPYLKTSTIEKIKLFWSNNKEIFIDSLK